MTWINICVHRCSAPETLPTFPHPDNHTVNWTPFRSSLTCIQVYVCMHAGARGSSWVSSSEMPLGRSLHWCGFWSLTVRLEHLASEPENQLLVPAQCWAHMLAPPCGAILCDRGGRTKVFVFTGLTEPPSPVPLRQSHESLGMLWDKNIYT